MIDLSSMNPSELLTVVRRIELETTGHKWIGNLKSIVPSKGITGGFGVFGKSANTHSEDWIKLAEGTEVPDGTDILGVLTTQFGPLKLNFDVTKPNSTDDVQFEFRCTFLINDPSVFLAKKGRALLGEQGSLDVNTFLETVQNQLQECVADRADDKRNPDAWTPVFMEKLKVLGVEVGVIGVERQCDAEKVRQEQAQALTAQSDSVRQHVASVAIITDGHVITTTQEKRRLEAETMSEKSRRDLEITKTATLTEKNKQAKLTREINPAPSPPTIATPDYNAWQLALCPKPAADWYVNSAGMRFRAIPGTEILFAERLVNRADFKKVKEMCLPLEINWPPDFDKFVNSKADEKPLRGLSLEQSQGICAVIAEIDRKTGKLRQGGLYRLPKDTEWSAAAGLDSDFHEELAWQLAGCPPPSWAALWPPEKWPHDLQQMVGVAYQRLHDSPSLRGNFVPDLPMANGKSPPKWTSLYRRMGTSRSPSSGPGPTEIGLRLVICAAGP